MNINMPGFTGEVSVYKARMSYRTTRIPNDSVTGQGIWPQLPRQLGLLSCLAGCHDSDVSYNDCATVCFFEDFITQGEEPSGGGTGPRPRLVCSQCKSYCLRKPLAQRAACLANCEDLFC